MITTMTATIALLDGMALRAETGSGHTLTLDAAPSVGGQERGPRPVELLLLALGGCTSMDVISILRKMRQTVTDYRVLVHGERAEAHPQVFTSLIVEHVITGRQLDETLVRRAIELSDTRYCPAHAMLSQAAPIATRYRLIDAETGTETRAEMVFASP